MHARIGRLINLVDHPTHYVFRPENLLSTNYPPMAIPLSLLQTSHNSYIETCGSNEMFERIKDDLVL